MDKHALDPACLLGDRLQTLSRAELTALAEALCRILAERGTYHGGIRPDNISRAADGTVGLGAPARTDTKDWTTEELEFMAPEVFWSGTLDASADVYSLGLLLYAGVSGGRLPFYPDDRAPLPEDQTDALRRRMNGEALPPARKAGRGLQEIIARATQCKPDDRYATPAELCAALEQYDAEQRRSVPTAQEMFNKPEQELSEVERMMLDILTEEAAAPAPEAEAEPETPAEETPAAPEAEPATAPMGPGLRWWMPGMALYRCVRWLAPASKTAEASSYVQSVCAMETVQSLLASFVNSTAPGSSAATSAMRMRPSDTS